MSTFEDGLLERRILRIGAVQTSFAADSSEPFEVQRAKVFTRIETLIEAASAEGVNILCLPEMWCEFVAAAGD